VLGGEIGWDEAIRLVTILRADPSSMLAAAREGWAHPVVRTDAVLMDLYDLEHRKAGQKGFKPYPRPWKTDRSTTRVGNAAGRTRDQVIAILRAHGHGLTPPPTTDA